MQAQALSGEKKCQIVETNHHVLNPCNHTRRDHFSKTHRSIEDFLLFTYACRDFLNYRNLDRLDGSPDPGNFSHCSRNFVSIL
jgi:hypothetical protein